MRRYVVSEYGIRDYGLRDYGLRITGLRITGYGFGHSQIIGWNFFLRVCCVCLSFLFLFPTPSVF